MYQVWAAVQTTEKTHDGIDPQSTPKAGTSEVEIG